MRLTYLLIVCLCPLAVAQERPRTSAAPPPAPMLTVSEVATAKSGDLIVLDTRTNPEWEAIRIPGSRNVPGTSLTLNDLLDLRARDADKPRLVLVGQSSLDPSTRIAAERATAMGYKGIYLLAGGVEAWVAEQPSRTIVFGQPYDAPESKPLLANEKIVASMVIPKDAFLQAARSEKFTLLDVRLPTQRLRKGTLKGKWASMDPEEFVWALRNRTVPQERLLIADFDGSMIPWMVMYLRRFGVTESRFLEGGSRQLDATATAAVAPPPGPIVAPIVKPAAPATPPETITLPPK